LTFGYRTDMPCAIAWRESSGFVASFHEVTDHARLHGSNCDRRVVAMTRRFTTVALAAAALACHGGASAQTFTDHAVPPDGRPPFTVTLSNTTPLAIGMSVEETSQALGQPLHFISGPSRAQIYLALRSLGGSGLLNHRDRLFLQFRNGQLTGWKEDYGQNWMWR
jgi:hypothetical protein